MKTKSILLGFLLICSSSFQLFSQAGYSSGSVSMNRSKGGTSHNSNYNRNTSIKLPQKVDLGFSSDQVIIEEYLNYHRHLIALPDNGADISMELKWANNCLNADGTGILQVGLATKRIVDNSNIPPMNICLVIDRSGSMSGDGRLDKVKTALYKFIEGLRKTDKISVVIYDDVASVALAPVQAGDLSALKTTIAGLTPGGSTNLHGGMVLGYEQVLKNYHANGTNRVILLTDGLANAGVVHSDSIIAHSSFYNKKGIDISTIGVGSNVNFDLLHAIAKNGKGLNHFVGDDQEDIQKVFVDELESLLSPIAKDVSLEINFPKGIEVGSIMGYQPTISGNKITFHLDNMNSGLTQVVLIKFKYTREGNTQTALPFQASLNYYSYSYKKTNVMDEAIDLQTQKVKKDQEYFTDKEVKKNYWIGYMAEQLKEVARLVENDKEKDALSLVNLTIKQTDQEFPLLTDADILRVRSILKDNADKLN